MSYVKQAGDNNHQTLYLISEYVIVDIVFLGSLHSQDKSLHKLPHCLTIIGQLTRDLKHQHEGKRMRISGTV